MRDVAVIGVGLTKFGERWNLGLKELMAEAGLAALEDASISSHDVEMLYGGTMASGRFIGQEHTAALMADQLGFGNIPAVRIENACASGGSALRQGYIAVASGIHDVVVVGGVEKMTDVTSGEASTALGGAGDQEWELFQGITFPGLYALMARRHMFEYGTTEEQMASVSVKNHENACRNEFAQFRKRVSIDDVMGSKMVSDPLKLLDCSPISDGAAAVVLAPLEKAKKYNDTPIKIVASAQASDTLRLADRESLTELKATKIAGQNAYRQAGVTADDIDVVEVHDCFTIAELLAMEDLGFYGKGKAGKAVQEGETALNGRISVNTSGGLKGCGHPVGATGVKQAAEIVWQLRGDAKDRQVNGAEIGMTHNVGGSGATAVVHIYKRAD
ncbi:MAG: thiolase domain-containing protein [Candidatus Marsarchaeota archaeon]|nr:thiolase domain-containing protein [Candidatus Marsarchaeota archaeon]MCL5413326.1 thiolase domain-containing protein [Candidatus Marsarchaeota archaeon]